MSANVKTLVNQPYKYGFVTDIETEQIPRGLSEDVVRLISAKKNEPEFMLEFRLKAYRQWLKNDRTNLASCSISRDRLPRYCLLFCTQKEAGEKGQSSMK